MGLACLYCAELLYHLLMSASQQECWLLELLQQAAQWVSCPALLQVCAVTQNGGFASEIVVRESAVVKLPPHSDVAAAAGLPVAFGTAHLALKERANLKAGGSAASVTQLSNSRAHMGSKPWRCGGGNNVGEGQHHAMVSGVGGGGGGGGGRG